MGEDNPQGGGATGHQTKVALPLLCRFSDAGNGATIDGLDRPASEKRQGRKSRDVRQRQCSGRYGDLAAGYLAGRFERSGRCGRVGSKNRSACAGVRADCGLRDRIGGGVAGRSGWPGQAGALPAGSRPEWRVSVRWWIGGDGIMRCRSRSRPEKVLGGASARSRARRSR